MEGEIVEPVAEEVSSLFELRFVLEAIVMAELHGDMQ
jgi:hypothetical protein